MSALQDTIEAAKAEAAASRAKAAEATDPELLKKHLLSAALADAIEGQARIVLAGQA